MSKRKWHERVREIQQRNPAGLHPLLRGRVPTDRGSKAWDRVEWQTKGKDPFPAQDAARPILLVLRWLKTKSLLSSSGVSTLDRAVAGNLDALALERHMVLPVVQAFLDLHYDSWHAGLAANIMLGGGPSSQAQAEAELDRLWSHHPRTAG